MEKSAPGMASQSDQGWRGRKREQTKQRIHETAIGLFLKHGFDAVTIDSIADASGIARRTFFRYFASKDDLLFGYQDLLEASFQQALAGVAEDVPPFEAMRAALADTNGIADAAGAKAIDDLIQSTDALRARKQANYERMEKHVYRCLAERWPDHSQHLQLRMFAMIGVGAIRIASGRWSADGAISNWQENLDECFAALTLPCRAVL